jgi:hypothetical protein
MGASQPAHQMMWIMQLESRLLREPSMTGSPSIVGNTIFGILNI